MSKDRTKGNVNEGIQGPVTAEVVAVGRKAKATKIVNSGRFEAAEKAVDQLRDVIAKLQVKAEVSEEIDGSLHAIKSEAKQESPNLTKVKSHLSGILDKLKSAGVVVAEIAAIVEPIRKIATVFNIPFL